MTREDEYTVTLSSGKVVTLITALLCAMLACFVTGLVVGRSPQIEVSSAQLEATSPSIAPPPEPTPAEQPALAVRLPEIAASAKPAEAPLPAPPKEEPKPVARKTEPTPAPSVAASAPTYSICVLSARNKDSAESYAAQLRKSGFKASVIATEPKSGAVWYRTLIGQFPSRDTAERELMGLRKKSEFSDAFITLR